MSSESARNYEVYDTGERVLATDSYEMFNVYMLNAMHSFLGKLENNKLKDNGKAELNLRFVNNKDGEKLKFAIMYEEVS